MKRERTEAGKKHISQGENHPYFEHSQNTDGDATTATKVFRTVCTYIT